MNAQDLLKAIEADESSHISFLQRFVQVASPNPPGDTREAADVILGYLRSHGIEPEIIAPREHMPNVVSEFACAGSGPRLSMNGHIDVFPVGDSSDWTKDPWSGEVSEGQLHGRGTVDMKAGTAASIIAYTYLHRYREYLQGSVALTAVSDEETGGKYGSKYLLVNERWRGDCMINAEPGGVNTIRFAEKGTLRLTFTITTEGAHGAHVHRSKNAIRIAASLINALSSIENMVPDIPFELKHYLDKPEVRNAIDEAMGQGAADIILKATLNIGTIKGGLKVNMIPSSCVFEADVRCPIGLPSSTITDHIHTILKSYPEAEVTIQTAASNPASSSEHDHPMVGVLARNAEKAGLKKPVAIPSLGATDCKFWRYVGVPAFVFGVSPETMAAKNESVSVDEYLKVIKTHALAGWEYLRGNI